MTTLVKSISPQCEVAALREVRVVCPKREKMGVASQDLPWTWFSW